MTDSRSEDWWVAFTARIGLLAVASFMLYACSDVWFRLSPIQSPESLVLFAPWFLLLGGFATATTALVAKEPAKYQFWGFIGLLVTQWVVYAVRTANGVGNSMPSDNLVFSTEAALLVLAGENPYGYPMVDGYSTFEGLSVASTPLLDGGMVQLQSYPALHFLVLLPAVALGLEAARLVYNIAYTLILLLLYQKTDQRFKLLVLLPLLANTEYSRYPLSGSSDSVWVLLLALTIWYWKAPNQRGVLYGLACAYKQTPWLIAPYLLFRVWKEDGWKEAGRFTALSAVTFFGVNLPFMLGHWSEWFNGVLDPILRPLVPYGRGLSLLTQSQIVSFPRLYYSCIVLLVAGFLLAVYALNFQRFRGILWLFPAIILFFSFRSLQHYFIYSIPLLLMEWEPNEEREESPLFWKIPSVVTAVLALGLTVGFWPGPSTLSAKLVSTGPEDSNYITIVDLELENFGRNPVRPRFLGRPDWHVYPWYITHGPDKLEPGEKAVYRVSTTQSFAGITERHGGRLLITDADDPHRYLAGLDFFPVPEQRYPRAISANLKQSWKGKGSVHQRGDEIELRTPGRMYSKLSRWSIVPGNPLEFSVFLPAENTEKARFSLTFYGVGDDRISYYFGGEQQNGFFRPEHFYKVLPHPKGEWADVSIDVKEAFIEAGFALPPLQSRTEKDIELVDRFVFLEFTLDSEDTAAAKVRGFRFEPRTALERTARQAFHRREYSAIQGDLALRERRYEDALEHYRLAEMMTQPRDIAPLDPFYVILGEINIARTEQKRRDFRLFLKEGSSPEFIWDRSVQFELMINGEKVAKEWSAPTTGVYNFTLITDIKGKLRKIKLSK